MALGSMTGTDVWSFPVERPNILFIAVDDLRPELGCYGIPHAQSPHLDRFAKTAVTFQRHFVQVPTCGASRFAMLTGQSPLQSGALGNQSLYQGKTSLRSNEGLAAQTFPELFRRNGYETVCIGKISHTPDGKVFNYDGTGDGRSELPHAWDQFATPYGPWKRGWGTFFAYEGGRHREDGLGHKDLMEFTAKTDDALPDGMMATAAIEKLAELKSLRLETGKPFLMGL
ncbi:MAG: sulfatase-like hydrolase/transferase, partial [Planctomycetaceae bacterium]|nr:sulfatase-like hydrolase/transferase [Planctomycetaceae bacterium]